MQTKPEASRLSPMLALGASVHHSVIWAADVVALRCPLDTSEPYGVFWFGVTGNMCQPLEA